ncbi:hypothetical protein NUW54_g5846 [Trametes sanguinea]|uniref:Uncharacterized protein n=1 Tax=Trametes sanguinea TaxID=158606 RepID=A0ACC1PVU0_9APHY|nr:hypothetical protein NUW54_g5846 [Trametes sanguinea]
MLDDERALKDLPSRACPPQWLVDSTLRGESAMPPAMRTALQYPSVYALLSLGAILCSGCVVARSQATISVYSNSTDIYPLPNSPACADALAAPIQEELQ